MSIIKEYLAQLDKSLNDMPFKLLTNIQSENRGDAALYIIVYHMYKNLSNGRHRCMGLGINSYAIDNKRTLYIQKDMSHSCQSNMQKVVKNSEDRV
ncbi:MAG: hypothetical protein DWB56_12570 [Candidatus Jettenia sp.]|uniref:Uncharacterized protein n=1 Tax=Candidatus Jettenia caeni TaxID=247490 RepID=I3IGG2_9BACT|nr:hypothetical protein [Candidatus Jettenia sp. AMX1]MBC6929770.1 hypothetical protein [Candidatus Jettenia sp.]NUN22709.1 hypothetical protein [Candidatus Jettenia caeni]KAA0248802.1 MAG: hypothetical protein EDM77_11235 [Candidatus Jettenia sp. AMX1]MCE7881414.1 hypothetical protein [Candidatus Jettenia sp. AMX1]MCQ3927995.1 hypothetical protein [Candidatus Jettenia sp.]